MEEPLTSFSKQYRTSSGNDDTLIQPANPRGSIYDICNIIITANRYLLVKLWWSNGPFAVNILTFDLCFVIGAPLVHVLVGRMAAAH